jgi:peptide/nickel transport system substrate-binding protein
MDEAALRRRIDAVQRGELARRDFVAQLGRLGIAAPMAVGLLADAALAQGQTSAQAVGSVTYKPTRRGGAGLLKILMWQGPTLLNPHFATGAKDLDGCRLFYEPLARYDPEGHLLPVLAAEIPSRDSGSIAADGRSTTWKLKAGVQWHDGKPFGADDVIFNWQYATDPATAAVSVGFYENVKAIEKIDALTVRVVFDRPTPLWNRSATQQLIPRHLHEAYKGARSREAPGNLRPVGTGPYRFVEFKPGDLARGALNPNYHAPNRPHFDAVEIKGGGDAASAARAVLQTGEYDFGWNLLVEDEILSRMEAGGKGRVATAASGNLECVLLNMADPGSEVDGERAHPRSRHPILSDIAVRQALALLFDRASVQSYIYGRTGVATVNALNNPPPYNSPNIQREFSVDKANALLDAAGWKRGADGVREKSGRRLKLLFQTSINGLRQKVQAIFKQTCGKAGIEIETKAVTATVFFSSDVGNPDTLGKFWADLEMFANSARAPDPDRYMQRFVSWEAASRANKWMGLNEGRWASAAYDRDYKASEAELDPVKRTALFIRMNDLVCNDYALIPVVYRPVVNGLANKLNATVSGWDAALAGIADWYRET